jgi:hypothetical protein
LASLYQSSFSWYVLTHSTTNQTPPVVTNDNIWLYVFFCHWDIHKSSPMLWYVTGEGEKAYHLHFIQLLIINNILSFTHPPALLRTLTGLRVSFTDRGHSAPAKPFLYITRKTLKAGITFYHLRSRHSQSG